MPTPSTLCVSLLALAFGFTGAVLVRGPLSIGVPTADALLVGGVLSATVALLALRIPPSARPRFVSQALVGVLPIIGVVAAMYASPDLVHLVTRTSALGWVLAPTILLIAAIAAHRVGAPATGVDVAFGGTAGVAVAALVHVAAADHVAFDDRWALPGWAAGALVVFTVGRLPPRPALRTTLGITWRTLPVAASWTVAIITALPAAPRHELSTSSGAQVLAVTISVGVLLACAAFWRGEQAPTARNPWSGFRIAMHQFAPGVVTAALLLVGGLQAASYSEITIDDLGQFWQAADGLTRLDYPAGEFRAVLPGLPILLLGSFAALGRTFPAALAPMFVANLLLPWLMYRAALAAGADRSVAFTMAILATVLPVVQVYSLGSAEPDPVFIALLAAAVWSFAHVLQAPEPRHSLLVLGALSGALAITRPEGALYGGLLLLAGLCAIRSRWALAGCGIAGVLALPVVAFSLAQLGRPWPTGNVELSVATIADNASIVGDVTVPKVARVVLLNDLRFPLLLASILGLFAIGAACVTRRRLAFMVLPVAVAANVAVKLSISKYKEVLTPAEMHEFVRHVAYPLPVVAVLVAVGATVLARSAARHGKRSRSIVRAVGVASAIYLAAGSLYVLGTPEEFHHGNQSGSLLTSSIYVNAPELWLNPFDLPSGEWEFLDYRDRLFAWYAPFDNHSDTSGMAYHVLTGAVAAMGFAALLAASPSRRPVPSQGRRSAGRDAGTGKP